MKHDHARPDVVASIAAAWDDKVLECRTDRHDWKQLDAGYSPKEQIYERTRRCPRCLVEQHQIISLRTGEVLKNALSYKGTDGYLLPQGTGRLTVAGNNAIRLEMFSRLAGLPARPKLRAVADAKQTPARRRRRRAS
jgi:hypothetical protein